MWCMQDAVDWMNFDLLMGDLFGHQAIVWTGALSY